MYAGSMHRFINYLLITKGRSTFSTDISGEGHFNHMTKYHLLYKLTSCALQYDGLFTQVVLLPKFLNLNLIRKKMKKQLENPN